MNDQDIIKSAYADTLKKLYQIFFDSTTTAQNAAQQKAAEDRFQTGVTAARKARDKALSLLP